MKKYLCKTTVSGLYEQGQVYKVNEKDKRIRTYINLGYLEELRKDYKINKKEVRNK